MVKTKTMDKKSAMDALRLLVNAAIQKGIFNDLASTVHIANALAYLDTLPEPPAEQ
jgi:hypothetical protein